MNDLVKCAKCGVWDKEEGMLERRMPGGQIREGVTHIDMAFIYHICLPCNDEPERPVEGAGDARPYGKL
jgi:predicted nucleic-acid-binding Zn-ribbon protein